jgi:hypothetical protein
MTASIGNQIGSTGGIEGTRDEACDAVERHYEVMKAATRDQECVQVAVPGCAAALSTVPANYVK